MTGQIIIYVISIFVAYLLGTISPSYIISRIKNKDIRKLGTGNLGASNMTIQMGWKFGVLVAFLDGLKGFLPAHLMHVFAPQYQYLPYAMAAAAVLGHIFPFYLKFKGGKGFATFMGMSLALDWRYFVVMLLLGVVITVVSNYIVVATTTAAISLPVFLGVVNGLWYEAAIIAICSVVILFKHKKNYIAMAKKEEFRLSSLYRKEK